MSFLSSFSNFFHLGQLYDQTVGALPGVAGSVGSDIASAPSDVGGAASDLIAQPGNLYNDIKSGYQDVATGINDTASFLKWISWIFHPRNILRAVEFMVGIGSMAYGLNVLLHGMRRSAATHRTSVGSIIGGLFPETRAARLGARAGRRQGARDVAYRRARRSRLEESDDPPARRYTVQSHEERVQREADERERARR